MKPNLILSCLSLFVASGNLSHAAESPTNVPVRLDGIVAEALERNPELKFYQAELVAAKAGRRSAGLLANPEISGSVGQKRVRDAFGNAAGEGVAWSVSVMQTFEWPGRMNLRKAIANQDVELAELGLERFRAALGGRIRALAYGVFAAQEKAAAAREVVERFEALRDVLVQRDAAGLTPVLETRIIEATTLTMQRKANEATLAVQTALLELNLLRGESGDSPLNIAGPRLSFGPLIDQDLLLAMSRTNNFELRARGLELVQQGFRVDLARNERYPAISVGPTFSEENAGGRDRILGVAVSFPLPIWNRNSGNVESAAARRMQAEASYAVVQREVERKVSEAALTYRSKRAALGQWKTDAAEQFKAAAALADRHYRVGAVPVSTYVELQKQYLEAVESLLDTRKEALDAAQQIEWLTGLPSALVNTEVQEAKP
jgi:cobalt-zinc-cadmium efflux system outer membrane protein